MEHKNDATDSAPLKTAPSHSAVALAILIVGTLGILILGFSGFTNYKPAPVEGFGREAFRPADFPEIFGKDPVEGLASIAMQQIVASSPSPGNAQLHLLPRPPLSEGIFPCSNCHAGMETDETVRTVGPPHDDIILNHGNPKDRWCLDCHNAKDRDVLRLINGTTIPFEESPRLCGQCHGTVYRDWKIGIHGKRVGFWNGPKIYLLCVNCHNQHSPRFRLLTPLPPPVKPEFQRSTSPDGFPASTVSTIGYKE